MLVPGVKPSGTPVVADNAVRLYAPAGHTCPSGFSGHRTGDGSSKKSDSKAYERTSELEY